MSKSRERIVTNGRAAFYASIWADLLKAANDCGWALGLHGSLANDMDMMAMPWIEEAKPVEDLMQALSDCFTGNMWKDGHIVPHTGKPNNRIVYTMSIWADFHLDINIISNEYASLPDESELETLRRKTIEKANEVLILNSQIGNFGQPVMPVSDEDELWDEVISTHLILDNPIDELKKKFNISRKPNL